jgi:hypothetical protein
MEAVRSSSNIIHVKCVSQNHAFVARMEYIETRGKVNLGQIIRVPSEMETLGSTILGINERTRLPIFPQFGRSELQVKPFVKARLIALLRGELWHHLIENRSLLSALVSFRHHSSASEFVADCHSRCKGLPREAFQNGW